MKIIDLFEDDDVTEAWKTWATQGQPARRRLIIQIINAEQLAYRWESFERALQNLKFKGTLPADSQESIKKAVAIAQRNSWSPSMVKKELS